MAADRFYPLLLEGDRGSRFAPPANMAGLKRPGGRFGLHGRDCRGGPQTPQAMASGRSATVEAVQATALGGSLERRCLFLGLRCGCAALHPRLLWAGPLSLSSGSGTAPQTREALPEGRIYETRIWP